MNWIKEALTRSPFLLHLYGPVKCYPSVRELEKVQGRKVIAPIQLQEGILYPTLQHTIQTSWRNFWNYSLLLAAYMHSIQLGWP